MQNVDSFQPQHAAPRPLGIRVLALGAASTFFLLAMAGVLALGVQTAHVITGRSAPVSTSTGIASVAQANSAGTTGSLDAQAIAARVEPAVVDINTLVQTANGSGQTAGTGIIVTSAGEILTNNHVVEGATNITVQIPGHSGSYTAHVVGVDPTADVALIRVEGVSGLPTATLADSSTVLVGEAVVAIGNAGGVGGAPSVTQGSIVALDQSITAGGGGTAEQLTGMLQMDASIAPGDSGGPLVNAAGQVIGMITAGQSTYRNSATTVGFAIPTNAALAVVNQIRAGQASSQVILGQVGYLGITVTDLTPAMAARLGLSSSSGALVIGVVGGSPAAQAGLTRYAVITDIAGNAIGSTADLGSVLHSHKPGDRVQVTWTDPGGASHTATVTLTTGPAI